MNETMRFGIERLTFVPLSVLLVLTMLLAVVGSGAIPWRGLFVSLLWGTIVVFAASALVWVGLTYVIGSGYSPPPSEYGGDEIQVRILTIDAEKVVQATVDSLPAELGDVHVVAETEIDVDGAIVHAVPDEFSCEAVRKGRAIEWSRRRLDTDREFVLYLDEDSLVDSFDGLPDADVVQMRERPRRTNSLATYLADVYRMGVQLEQRAFSALSIPLFAWGGGIAVRASVEDEVTWDRETLVEDTAFVWAAAQQLDELSFELSTSTCANEAPPSLSEIVQQRRRWTAGNLEAAGQLPPVYQFLVRLRNYAWGLSPIVTLVAFPLPFLGVDIGGWSLTAAGAGLGALTLYWFGRGVVYYGRDSLPWLVALPLAPVVTTIHSLGTVVGILNPPGEFRVTTKVGKS